jgi:UDP-N-acetylglucosamine---dolichyl-phosphate N-acetylglucosaminyltransferase
MKSFCIILPAFNEAQVISQVLKSTKKYVKNIKGIKTEIVVVDDGSKDNTSEIVKKHKIKVLRHVINRGLGGALATGLEYAKRNNFDFALTMDSDGQHDVADIKRALKPLLSNKADVIIGSRLLGQEGMPWDRKIINSLSNLYTYILFRIWTTDSQSGFRAFNKKALQLVKIKTQGMEVSSEFFAEIGKHKLKLKEIPIKVIYTDYSRQKGQSNLNSLNISLKLLLRFFR